MTACALCESTESLGPFTVTPASPDGHDPELELCETCRSQAQSGEFDAQHWYCLQGAIWSEIPAVQAMSYRVLKLLGDESWAQDLLEQAYLEEGVLAWAKAGLPTAEAGEKTCDSNGTELLDGDTVTLIKDLDVKGGGFTAKQGTRVKGIRLTGDPENIEGRINKQSIVLKTKFLKKA